MGTDAERLEEAEEILQRNLARLWTGEHDACQSRVRALSGRGLSVEVR